MANLILILDIMFTFLLNFTLWHLLESPQRGNSNGIPKCTVLNSTAYYLKHISGTLFCLLYARLKNGRIMLYSSAPIRPSVPLGVRPSVCKLFRFRVTPPTVYVRLS